MEHFGATTSLKTKPKTFIFAKSMIFGYAVYSVPVVCTLPVSSATPLC